MVSFCSFNKFFNSQVGKFGRGWMFKKESVGYANSIQVVSDVPPRVGVVRRTKGKYVCLCYKCNQCPEICPGPRHIDGSGVEGEICEHVFDIPVVSSEE